MDDEKILLYDMETVSYARAIRIKCLDCCADNAAEVRRCNNIHCPLFPLRFGISAKSAIRKYGNMVKIIPKPNI